MESRLDPFNREERRLIEQFMKPCTAPGEYWAGHLSILLPPFTLLAGGMVVGHPLIIALGGFALLAYQIYLLFHGMRYLRLLHGIVPTYERLVDSERTRAANAVLALSAAEIPVVQVAATVEPPMLTEPVGNAAQPVVELEPIAAIEPLPAAADSATEAPLAEPLAEPFEPLAEPLAEPFEPLAEPLAEPPPAPAPRITGSPLMELAEFLRGLMRERRTPRTQPDAATPGEQEKWRAEATPGPQV